MTSETIHYFDTVVIGGGQAGLAIGYYLAQHNRNFVILDAGSQVGDAWRNRWDSLRLFTPARYSSLPGLSFPAPDDYFPTKDEMADYLEAYAEEFDLPVRLKTKVDTLTRVQSSNRYVLAADSQRFTANNVIVATGPLQHPNVPEFADELSPSITQLHSSAYQNPDQLPDDVLVVGAGNSGAEISVELAATDREVWLSGRDVGHIPTGLDNRFVWWVFSTILTTGSWLGRKFEERSEGGGTPLIRLSPTDIRQASIERVARTDGAVDGKPRLNNERVLDVGAVIWAMGFHPDYGWIELPGLTFDEDGYPVNDRGVVDKEPGVYFLGLPFQYSLTSGLIGGIGADARYIAEYLLEAEDGDVLSAARTQHPRNDATEGD